MKTPQEIMEILQVGDKVEFLESCHGGIEEGEVTDIYHCKWQGCGGDSCDDFCNSCIGKIEIEGCIESCLHFGNGWKYYDRSNNGFLILRILDDFDFEFSEEDFII